MAGFRIELFKGIRPRISARKLKPGEAQTSQNTKLGSGDLKAWDEKDAGISVSAQWYNRTIYRFDNDGTPRWFQWNTYVDVARGPVKGDTRERTYYTGDGVPKMTYAAIADAGGGGPYPEGFRDLGIPEPPNALSVIAEPPPESITSEDRVITKIETAAFIIDQVNYSVHPGSGGDNNAWTIKSSNLAWVAFNFSPGDQFRVKSVRTTTQCVLESAALPGVFVRTNGADESALFDSRDMEETGSNEEAVFLGWQVPEGVCTFKVAHRLQVGDVITITTAPFSSFTGQLSYNASTSAVHYEQSWQSPVSVTEDGTTFFQALGQRISASAIEGQTLFTFGAGFGVWGYSVDRTASEVNVFEDRQYVYTYVSFLGEEGPPCPVSGVVPVLDGNSVELTGFENVFTHPDLTNRDIDFYRIYRTTSTQAGTEFQLVTELGTGTVANPKNDSIIVDTKVQADLGESLTTATWFKPPPNMSGLVSMPNGMMVGFFDKTLFFCEPFFPHAYPPEYDQAVDFEIVGLAAFGNAVAVLTKGHPYVITGAHPRNANVRPYKLKQSCLLKESIATDNDKVYYASPDGLVEIGVNGARLVTEDYALKEEWASFEPDKMIGEFHDGKYFGFHGAEAASAIPQADADVAITGTFVTSPADEDLVQAGGLTLLLTVSNNTWETSGAAFNAIRQAIIDSFVSAQSETLGWNAVRSGLNVTDVVRTSDTLVTITLSALSTYDITATETLTATFPTTAFASAPANSIIADNTVNIIPVIDFSSKIMMVSSIGKAIYSTGDADSFAELTFSSAASLTMGTQEINQLVSYDTDISRWLIGARDNDAAVNHARLYTSDDDGARWVKRTTPNSIGGTAPEQLHYYPEFNTHMMSYGDTSDVHPASQYSPDNGNNWFNMELHRSIFGWWDVVEGDFASLNGMLYCIADGLSGTTNAGFLRTPASAYNVEWTIEFPDFTSITTSVIPDSLCTGNNKLLVLAIAADNDIELAEYDQVSDVHTTIGVIVGTFAKAMIRFGNDLFMICTDDFEISTVAADSESTIGNWSSMSGSKVANIKIHNLYYDPGDGVTAGWGWVAVGQNTSSSKGVMYNSTDGSSWTLRYTTVANSIIKSAAFNNYTTDQEKS